jgi:hypothetical protein
MRGIAEFGHDGEARAGAEAHAAERRGFSIQPGAEHNERETSAATRPYSPSIIARERLGRSLEGV